MNPKDHQTRAAHQGQRQTLVLSLVILAGFVCIASLGRWMERHQSSTAAGPEDEQLYMSGPAVKHISLGFNGLVADWYWMRSLQYVGRKILSHQGDFKLDDLSSLDLHLLAPMLDTATTLDPQFLAVYEYGAVVLPAINDEEAIKLLQKGIAANPSAWRLFHHLGYIYWQRRDYRQAGATYEAGARLAGAPKWMEAMSARMAAEGGSRATAREIYTRMYEQSDDQQVKQMVALRLLQLDSFDERDKLRRVLTDYAARSSHCASSWSEVAATVRAMRLRSDASGVPLDPSNTPYRLVKGGCDVDLDLRSKIPYK